MNGQANLVVNKGVQKFFALLVRQSAVVHHLGDVSTLFVWRHVVQQNDGGLKHFCSRGHGSTSRQLRLGI
jgi:hypothetical protein